MEKKLFSRQWIGQLLLTMVSLLFVGQGSWAQTITVGGQTLTVDNPLQFDDGMVSLAQAQDGTEYTLTLSDASISVETGDAIVLNGITALNVAIVGNNTITLDDQTAFAFNSSAAATVTFILGSDDGILSFNKAESPFGSNITAAYGSGIYYCAFDGSMFIKKLEAPQISPDGNDIYLHNNNDMGDDESLFSVHYYIAYEDGSNEGTAETPVAYDDETPPTLSKPGTLTAWVEWNDQKSDNAIGKYFGFAQSEISGVMGTSVALPAIVPTISNDDGITINYQCGDGVSLVEGNINLGTAPGYATVYAEVAYETTPFTVLNSSDLVLDVIILPPAPTIAFDNTKTYLNSDRVEVNLDNSLAQYEASILYSWDPNCDKANGNNYSNGVPLTAGTGTHTLYAWVMVNDVYSEKTSQEFYIKNDINEVILSGTTQEPVSYTGSAIVPPFTLSVADKTGATGQDEVALDASNYDVSYEKYSNDAAPEAVESIVEVGEYMVTVTGKGNYGGSMVIYEVFTVERAGNELTTTPAAKRLTYTGAAQELVEAGVASFGAIEYKIGNNGQYSTTIPKATAAGTYTVYYQVQGTDNYAAIVEGNVKVTIAPKTLTAEMIADIDAQTYTGNAIKPTLTVTDGNAALALNTDYTVAYTDSIDAGTATATITGKGNYTGSAVKNYTIGAMSISGFTVNVDASQTYTYSGQAHKPRVTVSNASDGAQLAINTDYTVAYRDSINAGTATVTVTGKGNYTGTKEATYTINPLDASQAEITLETTSFVYNGEEQTPAVTSVSFGTTPTVVPTITSSDYDVTYSNNINASETAPTVTVTFKGNFTGTASTTFVITKANLTDVTVTLAGWAVGAEPNTPVVSGNAGNGTVSYTYSVVNGETFTETVPTTIGNYVVKATIAESTNYFGTEVTGTFSIYRNLDITFAAGQTWASYYSSENLTVPTGLTAYVVSAVDADNGTVTAETVSYIPANQAVLLEKGSDASAPFAAESYTGQTTTVSNLLQGTASAVDVSTISSGTVYVLFNNVFRRATSGTIPANRGYLVLNGIALSRMLINPGRSTGIDTLAVGDETEQWYGIDGRKLNGQPKKTGLYIRNGKKVYVNNQ